MSTDLTPAEQAAAEALQGPVWYRDGLRDAAAIALTLAAARRSNTESETTR